MGLIVDKPKPGYGNTNDGNRAHRFFMNLELRRNITGLDDNLIKRFSILLRKLISRYYIIFIEFETFRFETRTLYLNLHSWQYISVTLDKILVHSTDVIKTCILLIGQLAEESLEAGNKDCRRFCEHHTRKHSHISMNIDFQNILLTTSDPVINSLIEVPRKITEKLLVEVLSSIIPPPSIPTHQVASDVQPCGDTDYLVPDLSGCEINDKSCDDNCQS